MVTPDQWAIAYLEKHGMIPMYDFVPSNAVDKATKLYVDFLDEDRAEGVITLKPHTEPPPNLLLTAWPSKETLPGWNHPHGYED